MRRAYAVIIVIIIAVVAVFVVRFGAIRRGRMERAELAANANNVVSVPVRVAEIGTGHIESVLKYTGTVEPLDEVDVYSKIAGRIISIKVEEGDNVTKDQVLAVIDPEVTGMRFEPYEVRAPIRGTIAREYLDVGSYVNQMSPIDRILDDSVVKLEIDVLEKDYTLVREGMPVRVSFEALPGEPRAARITRTGPVVDSRTGTATAEIRLENKDGRVKAGMFARVDVVTETRQDAVLMPREATLKEILPVEGRQTQAQVFVVAGDRADARQVALGLANPTHFEVISGLRPGDQVVVVGQNLLRDGAKVSITD